VNLSANLKGSLRLGEEHLAEQKDSSS
jgi:hypothetical protein